MQSGPFSSADLVINPAGRIYHLDLLPCELADEILIVGDPDRVPVIAKQALTTVTVERFHRGLRSMTGISHSGVPLSILTSGMGTPSLEVVLGEIIALNEIDFSTRCRKPAFPMLTIIRVGTSGGLQESTKLGTPIISKFAVGLDGTGHFYQGSHSAELSSLESIVDTAVDACIPASSRSKGKIRSYGAQSSPHVFEALCRAASALAIPYKAGVTVSNGGFFANQGRDIFRTRAAAADIDRALAALEFSGLSFENMEMEASFLLHLGREHGYGVGAVCCAVANRVKDTFATDIPKSIEDSISIALRALDLLRRPGVQKSGAV